MLTYDHHKALFDLCSPLSSAVVSVSWIVLSSLKMTAYFVFFPSLEETKVNHNTCVRIKS